MWFNPALIDISELTAVATLATSATNPPAEQAKVAKVAKVAVSPKSKTEQNKASLARLVARVCYAYDCPDSEIRQVIDEALIDYDDALTCYTDLAKQAGIYLNDDRRMCFECMEFSGSYCMAAGRGELPDANRRYEPIRYMPRRCQGYKAKFIEGN